MEFLPYYNQTKFMGFVPRIKEDIGSWKIIEVVLTGKTRHNTAFIARQLMAHFDGQEGMVFICSRREILVLLHAGQQDMKKLSEGIEARLPAYSCMAATTSITPEGLEKIQLRFAEGGQEPEMVFHNDTLLEMRRQREERVVMVADDDMFMRSLVAKAFRNKARVVEVDNASAVVDTYLEQLPDVLFLDIHMPGGSGLDVMSELRSFDDTAYVIIISSDSVKDNVLDAKKYGAKGFVAKPFTAEKLEAVYARSPSVAGTPLPQ